MERYLNEQQSLRKPVAVLEREVEEMKRQQSEIRQFERALLKRDFVMSTVQIIAMVLAIFGAGGYISYQNSLLIGQIESGSIRWRGDSRI